MQDVTQKRLAIVVMIVITALKISWAVGLLLKNDILQISFYNSFNTILHLFLLIGQGRGSPYRRGKRSLPGGRGFFIFFENHPRPLFTLKEGFHRFPLNPLSPQGTGDLTGKPAVLYSQTSSRPKGLLVEFDSTELRLSKRRGCPCGIGGMRMLLGNFWGTEIHGFFKDTAFGSALI